MSALALRAKAGWGYTPELLAAFTAELTLDAAELARAFVADASGRVAGFYALEQGPDGRPELAYLFVEPELHRRGIGRAMLMHALERVGEAGEPRLRIQGDPRATPFYESMGARRVGSRPSSSVPGRALPLFELQV